ncbi:MAG TPA: DUF6262 family protein [Acidimicrobiales bacterium]
MSDERLDAVERACGQLASSGSTITFVAVSEQTGIPRVTLYKNPALRASVDEHRARSRAATTLSGLASELAHQRLALEAMAKRVRRHEEQLRKLSKRA